MFKVKEERCGECLFSKDKVVSNERRKDILSDCARNDSHFNCHKEEGVCCRGFFDTSSSNMIRISGRLGMIEFV